MDVCFIIQFVEYKAAGVKKPKIVKITIVEIKK